MFSEDTISDAKKADERKEMVLFFLRKAEHPDEKTAILYANFTGWGARVEKHLSMIKKTLICIAVLLVPVALRACQQM